jgi:tetratricopeptide (TPR) repeat protein
MKLQTVLTISISLLALSGCKQSKLNILNRADLLAGKGKYVDAIKLCNEVLSEDSTVQLAYYQRGIYYTNTKEYLKGISDFDKIIFSKTNGQQAFFEPNRESEFASEEDKLTVYVVEATFMRGVAKYLVGSLNSSLNDFSYCIENNYKQASCYSWLGSIYISKGQKDKGCEMYANAIKLGNSETQKLKEQYCK